MIDPLCSHPCFMLIIMNQGHTCEGRHAMVESQRRSTSYQFTNDCQRLWAWNVMRADVIVNCTLVQMEPIKCLELVVCSHQMLECLFGFFTDWRWEIQVDEGKHVHTFIQFSSSHLGRRSGASDLLPSFFLVCVRLLGVFFCHLFECGLIRQ